MSAAELLRIIAIVFTAVTCVVIGDTAGKALTMQGVDPFAVAWTRFAFAALCLLPFSGLSLKELPKLLDRRVLVRAAIIATSISCILTALKTEPIANAIGAFFIGPVISYILAIVVLGERPSRVRSALFALSVVGVFLVVKPGFGATIGMFFALAAGATYGVFLMMTRIVAAEFRPRFLLISQLMIGAVLLTPFGLSAHIPPLELNLTILIIISSLGSALGNFLLVVANRKAEASLVAPLIYAQLIAATFFGIVIFGDWPDPLALLGLVLIAACGVGSLIANQSHTRAAKPKA